VLVGQVQHPAIPTELKGKIPFLTLLHLLAAAADSPSVLEAVMVMAALVAAVKHLPIVVVLPVVMALVQELLAKVTTVVTAYKLQVDMVLGVAVVRPQ